MQAVIWKPKGKNQNFSSKVFTVTFKLFSFQEETISHALKLT